MIRAAIYGKGGIGKSTLAANLSAALACEGVRVLQIGCDPKHDSTRLLLNGERGTTVLDYLRCTRPDERSLDDIVYVGYKGILCVEAGGPEPGVGCAGRGILSTFDLLDHLGIQDIPHDITLYDVLGDVVCGGFAVPLRHEYANVIYLVTSGEFMSIYAANNILRGVLNYDTDQKRIAGILFNQRGVEDEEARVRRFAEAVGLPILATFPRSDLFTRAERLGQPIVACFPHTLLAHKFRDLAHRFLEHPCLFAAQPLSEEQLEDVVLGAHSQGTGTTLHTLPPTVRREHPLEHGQGVPFSSRYLSKSVRHREPLLGCAFAGALHTLARVEDAVTIAHGPRSCAHIASEAMLSTARRTFSRYGFAASDQLAPPLISSEMNEGVVIFGGGDNLASLIRDAASQHPAAIFVITTCPSGIIGEDLQGVLARLADVRATTPVVPVATDGNLTGDYTQGIITSCIEGAAALIDPTVLPEDGWVNVVAEKNMAVNTEPNFRSVARLLQALDLRVNCRFVGKTSVQELHAFSRARLNLLAYDDILGRVLRDFLEERFDAVFAPYPFPVGFYETARWLSEIAAYFDREARVADVVARYRETYQARMDVLRPLLAGRRIFVVAYGHRLDWLLETAFDLGMEISKVAVMDYSQDDQFFSRYDVPVEMHYTADRIQTDIQALQPDLVLSGYALDGLPDDVRGDVIPICPDVGFYSGVVLAERWARIFAAPAVAGWRLDGALFED